MNIFKSESLIVLNDIIDCVSTMSRGAGNFGKGDIIDLEISDHGYIFRHRTQRRLARLSKGMQSETTVVEFQSLDEDIPGIIKVNGFIEYKEVATAITNWFCVEDGDLFSCRKNGPIPEFKVIRVDGNTKLTKAE